MRHAATSRRIPARAPRALAAIAWCAVLGTPGVRADEPYEVPPPASAAALVPDLKTADEAFHVVDPVASDGLMHHYLIDSRYGQFDAYGRLALRNRLHELEALEQLERTPKLEIVVGGVATGVTSQVQTVGQVVSNPIGAVVGIPKGIGHLLQGYTARGEELVDTGRHAVEAGPSAPRGAASGTALADRGSDAAKNYAERYLGLTGAERRWYAKLAVDPYTNNTALKDAVRRAAKIDAAASFGMRFVGIASIPGIDIVRRSMDAIYNEDPAAIRKRNREVLTGYGLSPDEIRRWQDTLVLSPTRQVLLLEAAQALDGVEGRGELFRHALGLDSDLEAQVYVQSVGLLVLAHRAQPVAEILAGVRLPGARRADGHLVVCGAFDALYWTPPVASGEAQLRDVLSADGAVRELWLAGPPSERARSELAARGWAVHEVAAAPP